MLQNAYDRLCEDQDIAQNVASQEHRWQNNSDGFRSAAPVNLPPAKTIPTLNSRFRGPLLPDPVPEPHGGMSGRTSLPQQRSKFNVEVRLESDGRAAMTAWDECRAFTGGSQGPKDTFNDNSRGRPQDSPSFMKSNLNTFYPPSAAAGHGEFSPGFRRDVDARQQPSVSSSNDDASSTRITEMLMDVLSDQDFPRDQVEILRELIVQNVSLLKNNLKTSESSVNHERRDDAELDYNPPSRKSLRRDFVPPPITKELDGNMFAGLPTGTDAVRRTCDGDWTAAASDYPKLPHEPDSSRCGDDGVNAFGAVFRTSVRSFDYGHRDPLQTELPTRTITRPLPGPLVCVPPIAPPPPSEEDILAAKISDEIQLIEVLVRIQTELVQMAASDCGAADKTEHEASEVASPSNELKPTAVGSTTAMASASSVLQKEAGEDTPSPYTPSSPESSVAGKNSMSSSDHTGEVNVRLIGIHV